MPFVKVGGGGGKAVEGTPKKVYNVTGLNEGDELEIVSPAIIRVEDPSIVVIQKEVIVDEKEAVNN